MGADTAIDLAPAALPVVANLISTPPVVLYAVAAVGLGGAVYEVNTIPDEATVDIALQAAIAVVFGAIVPAVSIVTATLLGVLKPSPSKVEVAAPVETAKLPFDLPSLS